MRDHESAQLVASDVSNLWRVLRPDGQSLSSDFTIEEFISTVQYLNPGKVPGLDSICPELILHAGTEKMSWLCKFLSSCLHNLKIPKIWRTALVVAILKLNKHQKDSKSYQLISLLCLPFKDHSPSRIIPLQGSSSILSMPVSTIDQLLHREQIGFKHGRSIVDQVTLLIQDIKESLLAKKKGGAVFVDLRAAYDAVWHCSLTCKFLHLLPDRHMVKVIMELVTNLSFTHSRL